MMTSNNHFTKIINLQFLNQNELKIGMEMYDMAYKGLNVIGEFLRLWMETQILESIIEKKRTFVRHASSNIYRIKRLISDTIRRILPVFFQIQHSNFLVNNCIIIIS